MIRKKRKRRLFSPTFLTGCELVYSYNFSLSFSRFVRHPPSDDTTPLFNVWLHPIPFPCRFPSDELQWTLAWRSLACDRCLQSRSARRSSGDRLCPPLKSQY